MSTSGPTLSKSTATGLVVTSLGAIVVGWWEGRWWWLLAGAGVVGVIYGTGQLAEGIFGGIASAIGDVAGKAWDSITGTSAPPAPFNSDAGNDGTNLDGTMAPGSSGPQGGTSQSNAGQK